MSSDAPGDLEDLRTLLNSWYVSNDTRQACDELADRAASEDAWGDAFAVLPRPAPRRLPALVSLRDGLRATLTGEPSGEVNRMLRDLAPRTWLEAAQLRTAPGDAGDAVSVAVWILFRAAVDGTLRRLRTCADCGWAFYDSSRNNRRTWCAMTSIEGGRACGSIAKTRAYRARKAAQAARRR